MAYPRTRRLGGLAAAALLVAVFPANIKMALDGGVPGGEGPMASKQFAYARLPMQLPMVVWALKVAVTGTPIPSLARFRNDPNGVACAGGTRRRVPFKDPVSPPIGQKS